MSSNLKGNGLISRAVREALSTLVAPSMCEQLIERSLRAHRLDQIPEAGPEVAEWLEQSLRPAVGDAVGDDAADLLVAQLSPIAAYAAVNQPRVPVRQHSATPTPSRGNAALRAEELNLPVTPFQVNKRPTRATSIGYAAVGVEPPSLTDRDPTRPFRIYEETPPETGVFQGVERITLTSEPDNANELRQLAMRTLPPPADDGLARHLQHQSDGPELSIGRQSAFVTLPVVLAATQSEERLRALEDYLEGTAAVAQVSDLAGLLDALASPIRGERLLLIDCVHPSVHVSTVAAIRQDLPHGTTVVAWGIDELTWVAIEREKTASSRWVRCSHEASTDDVGSLCSMLLG